MTSVRTPSRPTAAVVDPASGSSVRAGDSPVADAIRRAAGWLLERQHSDGYWVAELEGDTILESEYILLLAFLGEEKSEVAKAAARYMLRKQMPEGGWNMYPGGPIEISGSVKAYFALKLVGYSPDEEFMVRARNAIVAAGGADKVNTFTRFYLALLGQIGYELCPTVPPQVMFLPTWFPVNRTKFSAWSRTMVAPLSLMSALQPCTKIEPERGCRELFVLPPEKWTWPLRPGAREAGFFSWRNLFLGIDATLKCLDRFGLVPLKSLGIRSAERWMLDRFELSDGLGAIFPPMVWSIIALKALGYADDDPALVDCRKKLDDLIIREGDEVRLQPCKSPVWDTSLTLLALSDAGVAFDHPAVESGEKWLLAKQTTRPGDWSETVRCEPGGWYFEHDNEFYPDVDDTAMTLMALQRRFTAPRPKDHDSRLARPLDERIGAALVRGEKWMLAMQNRDGGWGAFDKDNDAQWLCELPFADHNAMIDPSTPDLAARVIEALGKRGATVSTPAVARTIAYLRQSQEADGSWFGRWGVNYIYGTWQALQGLAAVGFATDDEMVRRGADWLETRQQENGGWGESADTYADPSLNGQGPTTASQTAWGVLGLIAAGRGRGDAAGRGVQYLLAAQRAEGTWDEEEFTGTGFPLVFYLRYHLYRHYFPLMAISRWAALYKDDAAGASSVWQDRVTVAASAGDETA